MVPRSLLFGMLAGVLSAFPFEAQALDGVENDSIDKLDIHYGVAIGSFSSKLNYSNLDKQLFNDFEFITNPSFSVFAEFNLKSNPHLSLRPQLAIRKKGGLIDDVGYFLFTVEGEEPQTRYQLASRYFDIKVPVIYYFSTQNSTFSPYVFAAPDLGFTGKGQISLETTLDSYSYYAGYRTDVTKANLKPWNLGIQLGAGVRHQITLASSVCYLGLELSYEKGISNNYGDKEKKHEANNIINTPYKITGRRCFDGIDFQLLLSVPLDFLKPKNKTEIKTVEKEVIVEKVVEVEASKPCYTLDEISLMILMNKPIDGKTICSVEDIKFDFDKSVVKKESYGYLDKLSNVLKKIGCDVLIKGHTDNIASDSYNQKLSEDRAKAVAEYLIKSGINPDKIKTIGFGARQPLVSNDTEEGRAVNRRVEFELFK